MTKLSNSTYVLFAALILAGKATIADVPADLNVGVQAELDFFNDAQAEAQSGQATPKSAPAPAPVAAATTAPAKPDETTDQVVSDLANASK